MELERCKRQPQGFERVRILHYFSTAWGIVEGPDDEPCTTDGAATTTDGEKTD
jgi:hypothetical protein